MSIKRGMTVKIVTDEPFLSELNNKTGEVKEIFE